MLLNNCQCPLLILRMSLAAFLANLLKRACSLLSLSLEASLNTFLFTIYPSSSLLLYPFSSRSLRGSYPAFFRGSSFESKWIWRLVGCVFISSLDRDYQLFPFQLSSLLPLSNLPNLGSLLILFE